MDVNFGEALGEVLEQTNRFLAVKVPERKDLQESTTVPVTASNKYPPGESFVSQESLSYRYIVEDNQSPRLQQSQLPIQSTESTQSTQTHIPYQPQYQPQQQQPPLQQQQQQPSIPTTNQPTLETIQLPREQHQKDPQQQ